MKLLTTKIFIILTSVYLLSFYGAGEVKAYSPAILGRVVTSTGAPVAGVWVKYVTRQGNYRHIQTDSNGNYVFPHWNGNTNFDWQLTTRIDSDLNGANDINQAGIVKGAFGCSDSPNDFTIVPPVGMNGSFSQIKNVVFSNSQSTVLLNDIVFTSSGPASIPTPTPSGLTTKVVNFGVVPISGITGTIYIDTNGNGTQDAGEVAYGGGATITVTGTSFAQATTDGAGNYSFNALPIGFYTVYVAMPPNYTPTSTTNVLVTTPPGAIVNFGMVTANIISGSVYNDVNKNLRMDSGEPVIANAVVNSTGGEFSLNDGSYVIEDLKAGTYTISYVSPLPTGFYMLHPKPPTFQVTLGSGCVTDTTTGASCTPRGDVVNLNFAVSDSWPWFQTYGLDLRFDNGVTNILPASTTCGGGSYASGTTGSFSSPGIVFSGDSSSDFGQGAPSNKNWVVGGISYPEVFSGTNPLKISTQSLLASAQKAGIPIQSLDSFGPCKNPDSKCNLQGLQKGFYSTTGDIEIDKSANFNNGNYVIVADGDIKFINGATITVDTDSTLLVAAGRDIVIDPSIHASTNVCPVPAGQLQGIFSADRHITIEGNNGNCSLSPDTMINIDGTLIANAAKISGKFQNKRDLCADNRSYPTLTIKARPDFILNTPGFLTQQQTISHEETP